MRMDRPAYIFEYVEHIKEFPIRCFIAAVEHSCHHWHTDVEILFILDGALSLSMNNQTYQLGAGDVVLINSRSVHAIDCLDGNNLVFVLQFLPNIYESEYRKTSFQFDLNTAASDLQHPENIGHLQSILARIGVEIYLNKDGFQFYIKSLLYQLIGYLFRYTRYDILDITKSTLQDSDLARLEKIVKYIDENYQHGVSFAEIAGSLNLSLSQCSRFFKEKMGISFTEYLRHIQITHAKRLMLETDHTVLFISEDSGFTSLASFYRAFRADTGITPTEFRERGETAKKLVDEHVAGYTSFNPSSGYELLRRYLIHDQGER
jgi:AraC-like DNA-binding protein